MNKFIKETIVKQAENKNQQCWKCVSIIDVTYRSSIHGVDGEHIHVTNQFHVSLIRLDANLGSTVNDEIIRQCKEIIEKRFFTRLAKSDCNYGIEGLKRWDPKVASLSITRMDGPEENE